MKNDNLQPSPLAQNDLLASRYACSWAYFWRGFFDWWSERCTLEAPATAKRTSPLWVVAVAAWVLVLSVGALVSLLAPGIVGGLSFVGTKAVANAVALLSFASVVAIAVVVPLAAGRRAWRFSHAMCRRGWELKTGQRKAARRQYPRSSL